jgi:hypothetical protein
LIELTDNLLIAQVFEVAINMCTVISEMAVEFCSEEMDDPRLRTDSTPNIHQVDLGLPNVNPMVVFKKQTLEETAWVVVDTAV